MAWNIFKKAKHSKIFRDSDNPDVFTEESTLASLHYESVKDSGEFDTDINATLVRRNDSSLDGWEITQNGWHYALGKPANKSTDGWVGFGGRGGQNWFKYRLQRAGYLHWPTKNWQDVGGSPSYNRSRLSSQANSIKIQGIDYPIESLINWNNIWTTPSGGQLSASWRVDGDRLKEEITLNQSARTWIRDNRPPTTPISETYFGFAFLLDWTDIPKILRNGVLKNSTDDFADDGKGIELRDNLDRLLAFMPISDLIMKSNGTEVGRTPLRKRFYFDGTNYYLLVGLGCDVLAGLPSGDLVFDPVITPIVGGNGFDFSQREDNGEESSTIVSVRSSTAGPYARHAAGTIFTLTGPASGNTISNAQIIYRCTTAAGFGDDLNGTIYCEDVDDAADFATNSDIYARAVTGSGVTWTANNIGDGNDVTSPNFSSQLQGTINRAGWSSGNDADVIVKGRSDVSTTFRLVEYETSSSVCARLTVTYTAGAGSSASPSVSPSASPSASPSVSPSASPSQSPSASASPSKSPSASPSQSPSASVSPSASPSESPSQSPSASVSPSASPSKSPSESPSASPSQSPSSSESPSVSPSASPSESPSSSPSQSPSASMSPSASPSASPSQSPSASVSPSTSPSASPSKSPSSSPSQSPSASVSPSASPSASPSQSPSASVSPSASPSKSPSESPSASPSQSPSASVSPSKSPSASPSQSPSASISPSVSPSSSPSESPSASPSQSPSASVSPSKSPSASPSQSPSASASPSVSPSASPSESPSESPSVSPSAPPVTNSGNFFLFFN